MIVAAQAEAAEAGASILRAGGNAVDAAIACALVQGVVDPLMAGIAGFGSAGIYFPGKGLHTYLDFHAPSPGAARPEMWEHLIEGEARDGYGFILKGKVNDLGYQSACVPASLKAYFEAHGNSACCRGATSWRPRSRGPTTAGWSGLTSNSFGPIPARGPGFRRRATAFTPSGRSLYCRDDGTPKRVGDLVHNPDYANTLRMIAEGGSDVFFKGELAQRIDRDMRKHGGLITADDLASYQPKWLDPLRGAYRGYEITTNNPPGGGLMLFEMLNVLEHFDLAGFGHNTAEYVRVVCEAMKRATVDKDNFMATPVSSMSRCRAWLLWTLPPQWPGTSPRARKPMCRGSTPGSRPRTPPRFA